MNIKFAKEKLEVIKNSILKLKDESQLDLFLEDDGLKILLEKVEEIYKKDRNETNIFEIGLGYGYFIVNMMIAVIETAASGRTTRIYSIEKEAEKVEFVLGLFRKEFFEFKKAVCEKATIYSTTLNIKDCKIELNIINADAVEFLKMNVLLNESKKILNNIDLLFIDAMKREYLAYFKLCFNLLNASSIAIADNTISHMEKMRDYLEHVKKNFLSFSIKTKKGLEVTYIDKSEYYVSRSVSDSFALNIIDKASFEENKDKVLLDICCAPCSTHSIEVLRKQYDVALLITNHNVYPEEEYEKRKKEQIRYAELKGMRYFTELYQPDQWQEFIKGYEAEPEHGKRCDLCFEYRLLLLLRFAMLNGFDKVCSTLTISPHKDSKAIFSLAKKIFNDEYIRYLELDFKKDNGFQRSKDLCRQHEIYRQDYCGCMFSLAERENQVKKNNKNN